MRHQVIGIIEKWNQNLKKMYFIGSAQSMKKKNNNGFVNCKMWNKAITILLKSYHRDPLNGGYFM